MTSLARAPHEIRQAFATLREQCDPRGYGLLDSLESLALLDIAVIALHERLIDLHEIKVPTEQHSVKVPARPYSLPDVDGLTVGSGKAEGLRLVESGER